MLPDPAVVELFLNHLVDPLHCPFEQTKQMHNYNPPFVFLKVKVQVNQTCQLSGHWNKSYWVVLSCLLFKGLLKNEEFCQLVLVFRTLRFIDPNLPYNHFYGGQAWRHIRFGDLTIARKRTIDDTLAVDLTSLDQEIQVIQLCYLRSVCF